eukprot:403330705
MTSKYADKLPKNVFTIFSSEYQQNDNASQNNNNQAQSAQQNHADQYENRNRQSQQRQGLHQSQDVLNSSKRGKAQSMGPQQIGTNNFQDYSEIQRSKRSGQAKFGADPKKSLTRLNNNAQKQLQQRQGRYKKPSESSREYEQISIHNVKPMQELHIYTKNPQEKTQNTRSISSSMYYNPENQVNQNTTQYPRQGYVPPYQNNQRQNSQKQPEKSPSRTKQAVAITTDNKQIPQEIKDKSLTSRGKNAAQKKSNAQDNVQRQLKQNEEILRQERAALGSSIKNVAKQAPLVNIPEYQTKSRQVSNQRNQNDQILKNQNKVQSQKPDTTLPRNYLLEKQSKIETQSYYSNSNQNYLDVIKNASMPNQYENKFQSQNTSYYEHDDDPQNKLKINIGNRKKPDQNEFINSTLYLYLEIALLIICGICLYLNQNEVTCCDAKPRQLVEKYCILVLLPSIITQFISHSLNINEVEKYQLNNLIVTGRLILQMFVLQNYAINIVATTDCWYQQHMFPYLCHFIALHGFLAVIIFGGGSYITNQIQSNLVVQLSLCLCIAISLMYISKRINEGQENSESDELNTIPKGSILNQKRDNQRSNSRSIFCRN